MLSYRMIKTIFSDCNDEVTHLIYNTIREIASYKYCNGYCKPTHLDICQFVWCSNWDNYTEEIEDKAIDRITDYYKL